MGGFIMFKKGELVTRKSYNNDVLFEIVDIDETDRVDVVSDIEGVMSRIQCMWCHT